MKINVSIDVTSKSFFIIYSPIRCLWTSTPYSISKKTNELNTVYFTLDRNGISMNQSIFRYQVSKESDQTARLVLTYQPKKTSFVFESTQIQIYGLNDEMFALGTYR